MTPSQAALLLGLAASYDSRTTGRADAEAWAAALDGLDYERCRKAVIRHYAENTDRIMPAHIRRLARTTTDLHHGDAAGTRGVLPTGEALCGTCKAVHRPEEPCHVLVADDHRYRKALAMFRRASKADA